MNESNADGVIDIVLVADFDKVSKDFDKVLTPLINAGDETEDENDDDDDDDANNDDDDDEEDDCFNNNLHEDARLATAENPNKEPKNSRIQRKDPGVVHRTTVFLAISWPIYSTNTKDVRSNNKPFIRILALASM